MTFRILSELLDLKEAPTLAGIKGIVTDIKSGYDTAKSRHEKATMDAKAAREKAEGKLSKEQIAIAKTMTDNFVEEFFDNFPNYGSDIGPEYMKQHIKTRDQALATFNIFKKLADDLEKLRNGMNASLKASKRYTAGDLQKSIAKAQAFLNRTVITPNELPLSLISFVRKEASFFKRLIRIDPQFDINDADFKQLLKLKIDKTDAHRIGDAAEALNLLLGFMVEEMRGYAKDIAEMGRKLPVPEIDK